MNRVPAIWLVYLVFTLLLTGTAYLALVYGRLQWPARSREVEWYVLAGFGAVAAWGFWNIQQWYNRRLHMHLINLLTGVEKLDPSSSTRIRISKWAFPVFYEFDDYIRNLAARLRDTFQANRQFTHNAAHELQTPLAVIRAQTELLLQSDNLDERESETLGTILHNVQRLSRINAALLLLSRIETSRFAETKLVHINNIVQDQIHYFEDLIEAKNIRIEKSEDATALLATMNHSLADILITNLLQNAIRYTPVQHTIHIQIAPPRLIISNPGPDPGIPTEELFERFKRRSSHPESMGLGLSIVRSIADQSNLGIDYQYQDGMHIMSVRFPEEPKPKPARRYTPRFFESRWR